MQQTPAEARAGANRLPEDHPQQQQWPQALQESPELGRAEPGAAGLEGLPGTSRPGVGRLFFFPPPLIYT